MPASCFCLLIGLIFIFVFFFSLSCSDGCLIPQNRSIKRVMRCDSLHNGGQFGGRSQPQNGASYQTGCEIDADCFGAKSQSAHIEVVIHTVPILQRVIDSRTQINACPLVLFDVQCQSSDYARVYGQPRDTGDGAIDILINHKAMVVSVSALGGVLCPSAHSSSRCSRRKDQLLMVNILLLFTLHFHTPSLYALVLLTAVSHFILHPFAGFNELHALGRRRAQMNRAANETTKICETLPRPLFDGRSKRARVRDSALN